MQKNNSAQLRALYIILVPIVVLIIILNSGILQKAFPAARVHGSGVSVVRYNYYYYDWYNRFLEENEPRLEELGYDPGVSANSQECSLYDGEITWKDYFQQNGERSMAETMYYCDLADAAGYVFSERELAPVQERLAENAAFQLANNISAKNYYIAYYGSGVTEALYTAELTRQVKAQAYKTYLAETSPIAPAELAAYVAAYPSDEYKTIDIRVITFSAVPDRETGEVGQEQLAALGEKLARLAARYETEESFDELQSAFSECLLGDSGGVLKDAARADLPDCIADAWLSNQAAAVPGDVLTGITGETGYFAVLDGFGGSGAQREAQIALGTEYIQAAEEEALASDYAVERVKPGIYLATG